MPARIRAALSEAGRSPPSGTSSLPLPCGGWLQPDRPGEIPHSLAGILVSARLARGACSRMRSASRRTASRTVSVGAWSIPQTALTRPSFAFQEPGVKCAGTLFLRDAALPM